MEHRQNIFSGKPALECRLQFGLQYSLLCSYFMCLMAVLEKVVYSVFCWFVSVRFMYGQDTAICPVTPDLLCPADWNVVTKVRQHVYSIASIIFDQKSFLKKKQGLHGRKLQKKLSPFDSCWFITEIFYISKIFFLKTCAGM